MKEANKSALISAFIYPGAGHFYLKKIIPACLIIAVATYALFIIVGNIMTRALEISDKIIAGQVAPDIASIRELITQPQSEVVAQQLSMATTILIIVWIIGIIDSYRLGRVKDIHDKKNEDTQNPKNGNMIKEGNDK